VGDHVGDDVDAVAMNRTRVASTAGLGDPTGWVWINQVHGVDVHVATAPSGADTPQADAAITAVRGLPLAVVTADCAPIVIACDDAVGVVHAGHRGLELGVIGRAVAALRRIGTGPVRAYLGPCVHPERYEFGADDLARLVARYGPDVEGRTLEGRPALDIPTAVERALEECGIVEFCDSGVCTAASDEHFSYRRDGVTGRQVTLVVLP
jgi:YfiH family protein